jgi:hypothetical protein
MKSSYQLSPEELSLVVKSEWLLTKHRIIEKVYALFGDLTNNYLSILSAYPDLLPGEVIKISPKIYKGEMYRQLPYVMLDLPRYFSKENVFAIRSFFWWGNSFSIHLVLGGIYKEKFQSNIQKNITGGLLDNWYTGVSEEPWQHHFEEDNYIPVNVNTNIHSGNYLKLGIHLPLNKWENAPEFFNDSYRELMNAL